MSFENIERMFAPRSVAVLGASEKPASIGATIINNLLQEGFSGRVFPVNPSYENIAGYPAFKSVRDIPCRADLVIVATPITTVANIVKDCADMGCGGAVIISAGGRETGKTGPAVEAEISEVIRGSDFRIIGSNCLGITSSRVSLNAGIYRRLPRPGKMAFISQSGAICTAILDFAAKEHIGFSHFVSLGSMLDVDFADMIDFLGCDSKVGSILLYCENLSRIRNLMSAARAVSRVKPIIALKAGRTIAGASAAAVRTGVSIGEDAVYDAAFKRAGIIRVKTFAELFDCAEFLGKQPRPRGHGLAILTNAGGPGVMAVDALYDYGAFPADLKPETIKRLDKVLPSYWSRANPVDILGDASEDRYALSAEILTSAKEVDGLLIMLAPQAVADPANVARILADQLKKQSYPVFTAWLGGSDVEAGRNLFQKAGIPSFDSPERAVRAFMDLYNYSRNIEMLQQIPDKLPERLDFDPQKARNIIEAGLTRKNGLLSETESKGLLAAYGIPVNQGHLATSENEAVTVAERIGFPVVMKVVSANISPKSDVGGVVLDVRDDGETRRAFRQVKANVTFCNKDSFIGVSVQKMLPKGNYELIAGAKNYPGFGPVLLFGTGGLLTEVFRDHAIAFPPLNRLLARRVMEETRIYKVLSGYRNLEALDIIQLESILIRLSQLVTDFAEISEIDINPLMIYDKRPVAADARVIIKPSAIKAPLHLVISPYPNEYEEELKIEEVGLLTVRPIRPEDAPLLEEMFNGLSQMSVYYRFFSPLKRLPHHMLARFTQIDYDREIAMVAISTAEGMEKMLGVSRVITEANRKNAEFAILVTDKWHGKGIGAALLKRCLEIAGARKIEKIQGLVLSDNTKMLALGRKMGFDIRKVSGGNEYELTLNLSHPHKKAKNSSALGKMQTKNRERDNESIL